MSHWLVLCSTLYTIVHNKPFAHRPSAPTKTVDENLH